MKRAPIHQPLVSNVEASRVTHPAWMEWYQQVYDNYQKVGQWSDPTNPDFGKKEPLSPVEGLIAYADGVNWNPSGVGTKGYFWWNGTTWGQL